MKNKTDGCCPMCSFDYQVCEAITGVAKKHGLVVRGSVTRKSKAAYSIRFLASPDNRANNLATDTERKREEN